MQCKQCGRENPDGAKFCRGCGVALQTEATCEQCRTKNLLDSEFCVECGASLAPLSRTPTPAPAPALPASFASGRYQVQRFLGEGGKKRVYLAHDTKLDRDVAFALIKTDGLDAEGMTRIRCEAQAMGRLGDHPHVVTVYDIGDEAGQPYIISQYMAGGDVETLLQQANQ